MLVNNSLVGSTVGLTAAEQRQNDQVQASFAEYLTVEDTPEDVLAKITKNGVQSLMEHKIDMLKKQLTEKAMAARGVTDDQLAAMPADERMKIMKSILDEVQQQLKMAMNEQMKKEKNMEMGFLDSAPMQPDVMTQLLAAQEMRAAPQR